MGDMKEKSCEGTGKGEGVLESTTSVCKNKKWGEGRMCRLYVWEDESEDQCFQAWDWKSAFKTAVCFPGNHHAALGVANKTNCNVVDCWDVMIRKRRKVEKMCATTVCEEEGFRKGRKGKRGNG